MGIAKFLRRAAAISLAGSILLASPQAAGQNRATLEVAVNAGELVRLPKPASKVFIADPKVADFQVASNRSLLVFGLKPGQTTLYALSGDDGVILSRKINVTFDTGQIQSLLDEELPRANIRVRSSPAGIVLSGKVETSAEAADAARIAEGFAGENIAVVNKLEITSPTQVNIRVRVVEMSREVSRSFGFNWDAAFNVGNAAFSLVTANPGLSGFTPNLLRGSANFGGDSVTGLIDLLARENLITLLAEPNLTALSGETASFIAGGEFPIPVAQDADSITIEFKQFGVVLDFTPTVLSPNRISMRVRPEVSELTEEGAITTGGITIPAITLRRTETTVELASGQSFAVAGLLQDETRQNLQKLPGLGDLPILGALFQSENFRRNETELVIIATAYLVQPSSRNDYADPVAGFEPASDIERILSGKLARVAPHAPLDVARPGGLRLIGEAGFYY